MAKEQAAPRQVAQPPAPKPEKASATKNIPTAVVSKLTQDDLQDLAVGTAAELGWSGEPTWVKNSIRVEDAQVYLRKVLHETHQAALNKGMQAPTAEAVAEHLAITEPSEIEYIAKQLEKARS